MTSIEQRRSLISKTITRHGYASVVQLAEDLGVSTVTIRSDLKALEDEGSVIRSHGGAVVATGTVTDLKEDIKSIVNVSSKKKIGIVASGLVKGQDSIIIASGSTMVTFAEQIVPKEHLNVVTPSLRVAMRFIDEPEVTILQLGGIVYDNTLSTRGNYAEAGLDIFHCSKLFFGVEGFDVKSGLTCATIEEANLTRKMMQAATKIIVLADSTKFSRRGFGKICDLSEIDVLITDDGLSPEAREHIEALGVEVIIAR